ncbi:MAG TPA: hypothetical protein H9850_09675 [Candidatus Anaerobiospirillum pullistercoris]|uniref:Uncharacterized protein n=1 Tax=Candidatus Anaerobiospirillum pullistercoris TaxID=2838452 RepID=A0A9D1WGG4_9GAMM|nr:hypothetical protein [Candidatus Anaerobiospirillum pullistercoris]
MNNNRSVPSPQPQASQKQEQVYAQSQQDLSILASGGGTPPEQRFSDSASVGAVLDECDGEIQVESDTAEQINIREFPQNRYSMQYDRQNSTEYFKNIIPATMPT